MAREARHFVDEAVLETFSDVLLFLANIFNECCNNYSVYRSENYAFVLR